MRCHLVCRAMLGCGLAVLLTARVGIAQPGKPVGQAFQPDGQAGKPDLLPEGLRHVPPDALGFIHIRAGDFIKSPIGQTLLQEVQKDREASKGLKKIEQTLGIEAAELESVTILMLPPPVFSDGPPRRPMFRDRDFEWKRKMEFEKKAAIELEFLMMKARVAEAEAAALKASIEAREKEEADRKRKAEDEKRKEVEKRKEKNADRLSPVLLQEFRGQPLQNVLEEDLLIQPDMDVFDSFRYSGPLVIVTSTKALDRKKILKSQLFPPRSAYPYGPPRESVLFLSDRTVMIGAGWELGRYSEAMARKIDAKAPLQAALALGTKPHLVVAGGHMSAELRRAIAFTPFNHDIRGLAPLSPLLVTEAGLTLDFNKGIELNLQFNAPTPASAANALQAVKTLRVLAELALENSQEEFGESGGWKLQLEKAFAKALADARIEQSGTLVKAQLKMDVSPAVVKHFTKEIVFTFRQRGDRSQSVNNLKQIGLAMHNFHDSYKRLPAASINDPNGKPLLSWRVAILPYIEQSALYQRFDLTQPWDHPTNKALIAQMPPIYALPGVKTKEGETHYRVLVGKGTIFEPGVVMKLQAIADGTSNTIMAVEAKEATIWTRPDDLPFDPKGPLPKFGVSPDGFHVLLGDGTVRFIRSTISEQTLRNAIIRNDGQVLGSDWDN